MLAWSQHSEQVIKKRLEKTHNRSEIPANNTIWQLAAGLGVHGHAFFDPVDGWELVWNPEKPSKPRIRRWVTNASRTGEFLGVEGGDDGLLLEVWTALGSAAASVLQCLRLEVQEEALDGVVTMVMRFAGPGNQVYSSLEAFRRNLSVAILRLGLVEKPPSLGAFSHSRWENWVAALLNPLVAVLRQGAGLGEEVEGRAWRGQGEGRDPPRDHRSRRGSISSELVDSTTVTSSVGSAPLSISAVTAAFDSLL